MYSEAEFSRSVLLFISYCAPEHTQVLLSKEAMHRVCTFHAQEAEVTASGFKTQDAAETRHSAAPTGCASSRARACYGATTNEAD
jgi:hypothetical protein